MNTQKASSKKTSFFQSNKPKAAIETEDLGFEKFQYNPKLKMKSSLHAQKTRQRLSGLDVYHYDTA